MNVKGDFEKFKIKLNFNLKTCVCWVSQLGNQLHFLSFPPGWGWGSKVFCGSSLCRPWVLLMGSPLRENLEDRIELGAPRSHRIACDLRSVAAAGVGLLGNVPL